MQIHSYRMHFHKQVNATEFVDSGGKLVDNKKVKLIFNGGRGKRFHTKCLQLLLTNQRICLCIPTWHKREKVDYNSFFKNMNDWYAMFTSWVTFALSRSSLAVNFFFMKTSDILSTLFHFMLFMQGHMSFSEKQNLQNVTLEWAHCADNHDFAAYYTALVIIKITRIYPDYLREDTHSDCKERHTK